MGDKKDAAPAKAPYTGPNGAMMKDLDKNEVFVSTEHDYKAVARREKLGWTIVEDRRKPEHPSHPEYKAAE